MRPIKIPEWHNIDLNSSTLVFVLLYFTHLTSTLGPAVETKRFAVFVRLVEHRAGPTFDLWKNQDANLLENLRRQSTHVTCDLKS